MSSIRSPGQFSLWLRQAARGGLQQEPSGHRRGDASQNVAFFRGFLDLFPDLKGRPLLLTGESYAGVYGPTLAAELLEAFDDVSEAAPQHEGASMSLQLECFAIN